MKTAAIFAIFVASALTIVYLAVQMSYALEWF